MREIANYHATNLRFLLDSRGTKYRELAKALGISESHLNRVISGERAASESLARQICLHIEVDFLSAFRLTDRSKAFPVREAAVA